MNAPSSSDEQPLVIFMPSGRRGRVSYGKTVLDAAHQLGVGIESICGGLVTCGKCQVQVESGTFQKHNIRTHPEHLSPASSDEIALQARLGKKDCRLSCTARIQGDVLIYVPEESRAQKQIVRKTATARPITVKPAIRQVYVQVESAQLGEHRGDWGRLQDALSDQWSLEGLSIEVHALRRLQAALRTGNWGVTVTLWQGREVIDVSPGYQEGAYGLAVDIGTTTVAVYLCDLRTGELLATEATMNPQVKYGEDLMSRVSYTTTRGDGLGALNKAILDELNQLAVRATRQVGLRARHIQEAVVVGNTTMIHIFLGIPPLELGQAPFALANRDAMDIKAREVGLRIHPAANVHIVAAEAGHVGADNVAVLLAEAPDERDEVSLIVDIGTNAEIVLGNRERIYSASSPTGPAFEGAQISHGLRAVPGAIERVRIDPETLQPRFRVIGEERWSDEWVLGRDIVSEAQPQYLAVGICGSGIIEAVAEMYLRGIINAEGRFLPGGEHDRVVWEGRVGSYKLADVEQTSTGRPIFITQNDVRNIQLAKGALYAGAKLLVLRSGFKTLDRIVLAGAFGTYIDPQYAMILGLIPDCALDRVFAVGNAAGDGARIALLNHEKRKAAQRLAHQVKYIETAVDPDFQREFVAALHMPHSEDPFPHLEGRLPEFVPVRRSKRRRARRRRT